MENMDSRNVPQTALATVPFHGDTIITFEHTGRRYVAMRRIVENMGLNWAGQLTKLQEQQEKFACMDIHTRDSLGREQSMLCMPVEKLQLWLNSVNPNKIKDERVRYNVELYQAESAIALHDYWTKGVAVRGDLDGVVTDLDARAMNALGGMVKGIIGKALRETVPAMVEAALASDPRRAVLDFVSVRQMLDEAKAIQKGRNRVNRKIGHEIKDRAAASATMGRRECPHSGVWLYPRELAKTYMLERGNTLVREHNDAVSGQGILKLVRKTKPDDGAAPPL